MPTARKLSTLCLLLLALAAPLHAESRCTTFSKAIVCTAQSLSIDSGSEAPRKVVFQVPAGAAPAGGWPVVLLFHGALMRSNGFSYHVDLPFGGYYQGKLVQALLDNGFAVVAPNAMSSSESWQTNSAEYADNYARSNDYLFFNNLFAAMQAGRFGPLNSQRWYATGISSGGYNTSRMAVSFPGRFRALAIQSASYATCVGIRCKIPQQLPGNHPPTLFLHGMADRVVPWTSMQPYHDRLLYQGIKTAMYTEAASGHAWFAASPEQILGWFKANP